MEKQLIAGIIAASISILVLTPLKDVIFKKDTSEKKIIMRIGLVITVLVLIIGFVPLFPESAPIPNPYEDKITERLPVNFAGHLAATNPHTFGTPPVNCTYEVRLTDLKIKIQLSDNRSEVISSEVTCISNEQAITKCETETIEKNNHHYSYILF